MDSYYMLMPISIKKDDWKHKEKVNLSIDKAKEIQEFLMGRQTEIFTKKDKAVYDPEQDKLIDVKDGKKLSNTESAKRIINGFAIVEVDCELMNEYENELRESCLDNNVALLTRVEMLQYISENQETI